MNFEEFEMANTIDLRVTKPEINSNLSQESRRVPDTLLVCPLFLQGSDQVASLVRRQLIWLNVSVGVWRLSAIEHALTFVFSRVYVWYYSRLVRQTLWFWEPMPGLASLRLSRNMELRPSAKMDFNCTLRYAHAMAF